MEVLGLPPTSDMPLHLALSGLTADEAQVFVPSKSIGVARPKLTDRGHLQLALLVGLKHHGHKRDRAESGGSSSCEGTFRIMSCSLFTSAYH